MTHSSKSDKPVDASRLPYSSYLLRLWAESGVGAERPQAWRFSLEDPHTGEHIGFASLDKLCAFLRERTQKP